MGGSGGGAEGGGEQAWGGAVDRGAERHESAGAQHPGGAAAVPSAHTAAARDQGALRSHHQHRQNPCHPQGEVFHLGHSAPSPHVTKLSRGQKYVGASEGSGLLSAQHLQAGHRVWLDIGYPLHQFGSTNNPVFCKRTLPACIAMHMMRVAAVCQIWLRVGNVIACRAMWWRHHRPSRTACPMSSAGRTTLTQSALQRPEKRTRRRPSLSSALAAAATAAWVPTSRCYRYTHPLIRPLVLLLPQCLSDSTSVACSTCQYYCCSLSVWCWSAIVLLVHWLGLENVINLKQMR